jgi:hypothetical protein
MIRAEYNILKEIFLVETIGMPPPEQRHDSLYGKIKIRSVLSEQIDLFGAPKFSESQVASLYAR